MKQSQRPIDADQLLDAFGDALMAVTPAGTITFWSRGAERVFGHSRDEALGQQLVELLVLPEQRSSESLQLRNAALTGEATYEAIRRRKDGSEVYVDVSIRAIADDNGRVTHLAISERDVTVFKYVREAEVVAAKFRGLLDAAPDAMILVNHTGHIVLVNGEAERLFGYQRRELLGRTIELLVPERYHAVHPTHRAAYAGDSRTRPMGAGLDLWARRKDGSEFPAEISLSPVGTDGVTFTSAAIRNVSERRATEAALRSANKELESFSYSVAHDLRAPLRGMSGFAEVLLDEYGDKLGDDGLDCLNEIRDNAQRMGALIDALLSLSRVTRSELQPVRVDVSDMVRGVVTELMRSDPARAVDLDVRDGLSAVVDPTLGRTLIQNLIGNAWKFSAAAATPRLEFGALENDPNTFYVRDNGAGFDMDHASRLFAPFQRLHTIGEFPGTGVGLATAQRIVHRHGGRIWADAVVGKGATFYFTLPAGRQEAAQ